METKDIDFENKINDLIDTYGKLDFLEQALEKQKVTRQLINRAKFNLTCLTLFFFSNKFRGYFIWNAWFF